MFLVLLQLLAYSALATDVTQTQHWIQYTSESPYCVQDLCAWDSNPIVAGRPEQLEKLSRFMETGIALAPKMLSTGEAVSALALLASLNLGSAIANNRMSPDFDFPQYAIVSYAWRF